MKAPILLVGELNPYGNDPKYALYPLPEHASGARLKQILGLSLREYMNQHDRVNLCTSTWSAPRARKHARLLLDDGYRGYVLCGSKVARAFDVAYMPGHIELRGEQRLLVIPHPSGRNPAWNDQETRATMRAAYVELQLWVAQRKI